jgi:hypothetical protein
MDRESHKRRLERFSRNEKIFPGGEHETRNCTACARVIADRFGGEVRGYYHAHNPMALVGETEGGHDFAVTSDQFLVDPWLFHYYGVSPVLDMANASDRAEALARYGPDENWQRVPEPRRAAAAQVRKSPVCPTSASRLSPRAGKGRACVNHDPFSAF